MDDDCSSQASINDYNTVLVTVHLYEVETFFFSTEQQYKYTQTHNAYESKCDICEQKLKLHMKQT